MDTNTAPAASRIQMPGTIAFETTLGPGESKIETLQVPPDYDFVLHAITCDSDGPVLLKITVDPPRGGRPPESRPPQPFAAALDAHYPGHLAALAGETLEEWTRNNADLTQRAWAGDDPALFDLIGRDPRVLGCPLTVARVVGWRTDLEVFARYRNLRGSRLHPVARLEEARAAMEAAKKKLRRLGEAHIAFFDQRGKKPLPPAGVVKGLYYAFLCLFGGLKREFHLRAARTGPERARRDLLATVKALKGLRAQPDSFFVYVLWALRLLDELRIGAAIGLDNDTLLDVVGPRSSKPSEVAVELTAQVFGIGAHAVETLKQSDEIIPWADRAGTTYAIGGRPTFDLARFPEVQGVLQTADLMK